VRVGLHGVEVAVVVVVVADDDRAEPREVGGAGDAARLALVVEGALREPGVGEERRLVEAEEDRGVHDALEGDGHEGLLVCGRLSCH
jgi:hypothetical protein